MSTPTTTSTLVSITVASTTLASTSTRYSGCFIESDINYVGDDFFSTYVNDSSECCNLCGSMPACLVWSYLSQFKFCYLKNNIPTVNSRQNYTGMISGIVSLR